MTAMFMRGEERSWRRGSHQLPIGVSADERGLWRCAVGASDAREDEPDDLVLYPVRSAVHSAGHRGDLTVCEVNERVRRSVLLNEHRGLVVDWAEMEGVGAVLHARIVDPVSGRVQAGDVPPQSLTA